MTTQWERVDTCLACGFDRLVDIVEFGEFPLANEFLMSPIEECVKYPLSLVYCDKCFNVQLTGKLPPDVLYKNYTYMSGTPDTQLKYFDWFSKYTKSYHNHPKTVLDIGCNDKSQLNFYKSLNLQTFGIDPAESVYNVNLDGHDVICDYFENHEYPEGTFFDIIVCQNLILKLGNPVEFLTKVKKIMNDDSVLFLTSPNCNMIREGEVDICLHENVSFYNVQSMKELCMRSGLFLVDVIKHYIHNGTNIFIISKKEKNLYLIDNLINNEFERGIYSFETYKKFVIKCNDIIYKFKRSIEKIKNDGYVIIGCGASSKGITLLNLSGVDCIDVIVDENPNRIGLYTPLSKIPICSYNSLIHCDNREKYCFVLFPWNFFTEIKTKVLNYRVHNDDIFLKYYPEIIIEK